MSKDVQELNKTLEIHLMKFLSYKRVGFPHNRYVIDVFRSRQH